MTTGEFLLVGPLNSRRPGWDYGRTKRDPDPFRRLDSVLHTNGDTEWVENNHQRWTDDTLDPFDKEDTPVNFTTTRLQWSERVKEETKD